MLENLAAPDRSLLKHSPLQLVSFSVSWPQEVEFPSEAGVLFQAALKEHPLLQKARLVPATLMTFPAQPILPTAQFQQAKGWQLARKEFTASIYAESVVVEDRQYAGWAAFVERVRPVVAVAKSLRGPKIRDRVTLRYVNVLSDSGANDVTHWRKKIRPPYLGMADSDELAAVLATQVGFYNLKEDSYDVQLRTGIGFVQGQDTHWGFTIDIEAADRSIAEFDVDAIFAVAVEQNTVCLKLFQLVLEPEYLSKLRGPSSVAASK